MRNLRSLHRALAIFIISLTTLSAFFTNCQRASLGGLTAESISKDGGNDGQSITVGPSSCPTGFIAVGLDAQMNVICTPYTPTNQVTCPVNHVAYMIIGGTLYCLPTTSWDHPGAVCPVGQLLVGYTSAGAIQCANFAGANPTINGSCPAGQYVSGINNGTVVCTPLPASPTPAIFCPNGTYLRDIVGTTPDCQPNPWTNAVCPAGRYLIGWGESGALCQQVLLTGTSTDVACPEGKVLLTSIGGQVTCGDVPNPDLTHACREGYRVVGIANGKIQCEAYGGVEEPSCPHGKFPTALVAGAVVCTAIQNTRLPSLCPIGTYPVGVSNGATVCGAFPGLKYPGPPRVCVPASSNLCSVPGGIGSQTCNSDGQGFSSCQVAMCGPGYFMTNGQCVAEECPRGASRACDIDHGAGNQVCDSTGKWGACQLQSCGAGYVRSANACVPTFCAPGTMTNCTSGGGFGTQTCNGEGTGYGSCQLYSCQTGYTLMQNGTCLDTWGPRLSFTSVPSNPTAGSSAAVSFSAIDNETGVAAVTCTIDGKLIEPCLSPVELTGLGNGAHSFKLIAYDQRGNSSHLTTSWVSEVCNVGGTKTCPITNGKGAAVCEPLGVWGACEPILCNEGYAKHGNSCDALACGPGLSVVGNACVDIQPPAVKITSAPAAVTKGTGATVEFTAVDVGTGIASVLCQRDNQEPASCTSPFVMSGLSVGSHTLKVLATDGGGNQSQVTAMWSNVNCTPGDQLSCSVSNGQGKQTCSADGVGFGSCVATTCNSGYIKNGAVCVPLASCTTPWGSTVAHGQSVTAYLSATGAIGGQTCSSVSETRTCNNGTLSGSYTKASCTDAPPGPPAGVSKCGGDTSWIRGLEWWGFKYTVPLSIAGGAAFKAESTDIYDVLTCGRFCESKNAQECTMTFGYGEWIGGMWGRNKCTAWLKGSTITWGPNPQLQDYTYARYDISCK